MTKTVIVFASSGQQGSSFIHALSAHNTPAPIDTSSDHQQPYRILALSRSPTAPSMDKIKHLPGVEIVPVRQDYMDKPAEAFAEALPKAGVEKGGVDAVFACQGYVSEKVDVAQGMAMASAAHDWGCLHLIYSSAPLGPLSEEEAAGTFIGLRLPVEAHIKALCSFPLPSRTGTASVIDAGGDVRMHYTFLRPTQFMENLLPTAPYMFTLTRTVLLRYTFYTHPDRKHQMISVRDIGRFGALAITSPNRAMYEDKAIELAGDEYTMPELREKYRRVMGEEIKECWGPLAWGVSKGVPLLRDLSRWWDRYGFRADIIALKGELEGLEGLEEFLRRYKREREGK